MQETLDKILEIDNNIFSDEITEIILNNNDENKINIIINEVKNLLNI